jgi:hypothetical protein
MLSEAGRARGLYELAISQPVLDMPEAVWKAYIDFEISQVRATDAVNIERPHRVQQGLLVTADVVMGCMVQNMLNVA